MPGGAASPSGERNPVLDHEGGKPMPAVLHEQTTGVVLVAVIAVVWLAAVLYISRLGGSA
jgi:hypothetical protein